MPLYAGAIPEYTTKILSHDVRPSTSEGVTITSTTTSGLYGSFGTIISGASVTSAVYGVELTFSNGFTAGAARPGKVTIGLDPAGGTTYTTDTMVADLVIGSPSQWGQASGWGLVYYFPYFIPSGTSIGAKFATLGTTARNVTVKATLLCAPRHPEITPVGRKIIGYGVDSAGVGQGVAITAGTASEGAWTQIGTVAAGTYPWWWQAIVSSSNATLTDSIDHLDIAIGDATNKHIIYENQFWNITGSERWSNQPMFVGCAKQAAPGNIVYARMRGEVANTGMSVAVYGME